jgi:hypothetical protein
VRDVPTVYANLYPGSLPSELRAAAEAGVELFTAPSAQFDALAEAGERLIYVVLPDGILVVSGQTVGRVQVRHSVLAGGGDVIAAGEVELIQAEEEKMVIELTNKSGHYEPEASSLDWAADCFRGIGFEVAPGALSPIEV